MPQQPEKLTPVVELIAHIYRHEGHQQSQSWNRLNHALYAALCLAIRAHYPFSKEDFVTLARDYHLHLWCGTPPERLYTHACHIEYAGWSHSGYGVNLSAALAYEHWQQRKPYLLRLPGKAKKERLAVGSQFLWQGQKVHVTSITAEKLVACTYQDDTRTGASNPQRKIEKRFSITHAALATHNAACAPRATGTPAPVAAAAEED